MNEFSHVTVIGGGPVCSGVKLFIESAWLALRFCKRSRYNNQHCYRVVRHGSVLQVLCKYEHVTDKIYVKCKVKGVRMKVTSRRHPGLRLFCCVGDVRTPAGLMVDLFDGVSYRKAISESCGRGRRPLHAILTADFIATGDCETVRLSVLVLSAVSANSFVMSSFRSDAMRLKFPSSFLRLRLSRT